MKQSSNTVAMMSIKSDYSTIQEANKVLTQKSQDKSGGEEPGSN